MKSRNSHKNTNENQVLANQKKILKDIKITQSKSLSKGLVFNSGTVKCLP